MHPTGQIVTRILGGELDVFAELIRLYQHEVWAVVAAMLFDKNKTEDLVQQTFVSAYRHLDHFHQDRDFGAWIKEIARNEVRQELRSRQREGDRLDLYHRHLLAQVDDPATTTDRQARMADALRECIQKLPPAGAEMIQMRYEQALDFGSIAAVLGRSVEATRQQLARIRLALRDCIQRRLVST